MDFLSKEVISGFTLLHLGIAVIGLIVVILVLKTLFGKKQETGSYMVVATCNSCGWSGDVSRYNKTCKGCGAKIP